MKKSQLQPQLKLLETPTGGALLCGFDLDGVQEIACTLMRHGFVPVEEEYLLYEHKTTKQRGRFKKIIFIKQ